MKFIDILLLLILASIGFAAYYLYSHPAQVSSFIAPHISQPQQGQINVPESMSKQFYPNMRFQSKLITYSIDSACSQDKIISVDQATRKLEGLTSLVFKEEREGMLTITCSEISPSSEIKNHFIAGEGGPTKIINGTLYAIILEAKMSLYKEHECPEQVALHELLHVLGFDHNSNKNSILYPTLDCSQEIDDSIITTLNALYDVESLPDLVFSAAEANKSENYLKSWLNFAVIISNQGLTEASNIHLTVLADGKIIETLDLDSMDIGTIKKVNAQNLEIPKSTNTIQFVIDDGNEIREIFEDNNKIELIISDN